MPPAEYDAAWEKLMIELATVGAEIRSKGGESLIVRPSRHSQVFRSGRRPATSQCACGEASRVAQNAILPLTRLRRRVPARQRFG